MLSRCRSRQADVLFEVGGLDEATAIQALKNASIVLNQDQGVVYDAGDGSICKSNELRNLKAVN